MVFDILTPTLFDNAEPDIAEGHSLRHNSDPQTSDAAARDIVPHLGALHRWATQCVRELPGSTQRELGAQFCPTDPRKIGRRLKECEQQGLVRRGEDRMCSISGKTAQTWWPV